MLPYQHGAHVPHGSDHRPSVGGKDPCTSTQEGHVGRVDRVAGAATNATHDEEIRGVTGRRACVHIRWLRKPSERTFMSGMRRPRDVGT